ncbi:MAG: glutathione-disulfide reductase [Alphaproteobacteria bacterium]
MTTTWGETVAGYDYDLYVIGGGSGGVRAARMSAEYGARVAISEERYLGGTCVNVGCIPKKLLVYGSHFSEDFEDARWYGWRAGDAPPFDWRILVANKDREIARLNGVYARVLTTAGVEIHRGRATLVDANTVALGDRRVTAEYILVATGGWPSVPDVPGKEHVITSNEAFHLGAFPRRAVIVGGGYIAVEFAGIFQGLGAETTLAYRGPLFMRGFDDDVRTHLAAEMRKKGIDLRFETRVAAVEKTTDGLAARLEDGGTLEADLIMYATGRAPNAHGFGLAGLGVELDERGGIVVDDYFRSSVPNIFAIGDVIDRVKLTPVAIAEGMAVAKTLFRHEPMKLDYADIPTAVFSQPNVGTVGLTEASARERHGDVVVFRSTFRPLKLTLTDRNEETLMKLVIERSTDKVLGVHMVGPDAGEIIQGLAVAVKAGATKADFDRTIGIHPTAAEEFVTMRAPAPEPLPEAAD